MTLFEITNPFGLTPNGPGIVPAVLEFRETARSRRDAGATETIASTHRSFREIDVITSAASQRPE